MTIDARVMNFARKGSARNENDILQEKYLEEEKSPVVSKQFCSSLLLKKHVPSDFEFPNECYKFDGFRSGIIRRDSKQKEENVAFAGMDPGSAIKARSAREHGHPHEAQIIRRLSTRPRNQSKAESSWF